MDKELVARAYAAAEAAENATTREERARHLNTVLECSHSAPGRLPDKKLRDRVNKLILAMNKEGTS